MRRHFPTAALLIAWLCANGAIWDAMQVAAWGKMFAEYSVTMSVTQAIRETFDLSKPCEMCVGIAKAKGETEKHQAATEQQGAAKFLLALDTAPDAPPPFHNERGEWVLASVHSLAQRTEPVPLPPPRV